MGDKTIGFSCRSPAWTSDNLFPAESSVSTLCHGRLPSSACSSCPAGAIESRAASWVVGCTTQCTFLNANKVQGRPIFHSHSVLMHKDVPFLNRRLVLRLNESFTSLSGLDVIKALHPLNGSPPKTRVDHALIDHPTLKTGKLSD